VTPRKLVLTVDGAEHEVWAPPSATLLDVLHDGLGLACVRYGCGEGVCGTCTVLLDSEPVSACLVLAVQAEAGQVTTLAGLAGPGGRMHPVQESFLRHGASQCGFCTPGMMLAAVDLVRRRGRPPRDQIRYALSGNLCRCTGYTKILDAIEEYAAQDSTAHDGSAHDSRAQDGSAQDGTGRAGRAGNGAALDGTAGEGGTW
jgi:aerobic carbon-monoxide dehydrogenase small subunit